MPRRYIRASNRSEDHLVVTVISRVIASILAVVVAILDHLDIVGTIAQEKGVVRVVVFQICTAGSKPFGHGIIHLGMVVASVMSVISLRYSSTDSYLCR